MNQPAIGFDIETAIRYQGLSRDPSDMALHVEFYEKEVHNEFKSIQAEARGEPPVYDKKVYCIIRPPGRLEEHNQPVRDIDKRRFPKEWLAFQSGNKELGGGTSIEELPNMAHDQKSQLRHLGVYTIEQMAAATDSQLVALGMGARELRDRARRWVMTNTAQAELKDAARARDMEQTIKAQAEIIEELRRRMDADDEPVRRGRGRPRKDEISNEEN